MRNLLLLGVAAILNACMATGMRYSEHPASLALAPANAAKLTVYRNNDISQYSARSARLKLNGSDVGSLALGGFKIFEVPPGTHTFMVDMWDTPGHCELTVVIQAGINYFYEVLPRVDNFAAGAPSTAIPKNPPIGKALGVAAMLGGMAAESAGRQCGGAFSIISVDEPHAIPKLMELKESK